MKAGSFSHQTTALNKGQGLGSLKPTESCVCVSTYTHIQTYTTAHSEDQNKNPLTRSSIVFCSNSKFVLNLYHCLLYRHAGFLLVCVFCKVLCVSSSARLYLCAYQLRDLSLSPPPPNCICILIMSMFVQKHDRRSDMTKWK